MNNDFRPNNQPDIWFTAFQTIGGKPQAKSVDMVDGNLKKTGESIPLTDGYYWGLQTPDIDAFLDVVERRQYGIDTTLGYGLGPKQSGIIATAKKIKRGKAAAGAISRSAKNFGFPHAPAVLMLDGDPIPETRDWSPADHDAALCEVFGIISSIRRGILPSSGSGIHDSVTGERLDKSNGFRIYFAVDNGTDIPAIGNAMFAALVDAGYGYVAFAKNGRRMLRTFLDAAVWQPERVDFAFGSKLGEGLTQHRPMTRVGNLPMLRSADAPKVPDLAAWIKQSRTAQELLKAAEPESKAIRARWEAEREETSVAGPVARGWTREKALAEVRATIKRAEIGGFEILTQYDVLPLNDGSQITVREALSNRDYYHELALRDPFEPEAGMSKAKLYLKDQREFPVLNSQLHGGCVYRLIDVEAVFGPPLSVLAPSAGLTLAPLPFVLSAGAPTPAFHVQPELAPVPALPVQAQSAPSWMPSNVVPFRAGVAEPMPSLSGGGAMPAPSAEPVPSAPGRSYPDLMDEIPERINASIEKAEASDLGFVVRQLMMRQFTAGEVLLVLERSMIAHKVPGLAAAVTEEAKKFEQREVQRKLNFEIGNDTGHASGRPNTPFVSLSKMLKTFVLIRKGTMVASLDSFKVLSYGEAMADLAGSKTKVTAANGKDTKEVPTLGLWQSNLERTTVDVVTWGPGRNLFCHAPDGSMGMKYALNVYRGLPAYAPSPDWEQQAAIFDRHIEYLVPVAEERRLFTQWLAHMIQKPGELPHFAYVMITPTTGTGRNWLASVLVRVLRGYVATGLDMNRVLDSEFNGSLSQKLLAIVDECHEGMDGYKRHERGNTLKRIITEETRLINPKCERQHTEYNACRWLMFSNFEDPLPIDSQDRRIVYIENPKICQSAEYYKMLYGALVMPVFFDSVRHRLQTLDISDFNPGARAPWNEIKLRSLDAMKSDVDHALDNFVASWPGDFVLNRMVREYVQTAVSGPLDANHLKYAMRRAGFTATRKSIKYEGKMERIAILRKVTEGVLEMTSPSVLADYCRQWHQQFKLSGN